MKKYILSALISVAITGCFAQTQLPEGKVRGKHDAFRVHHDDHVFNNQKFIIIYSEKNKYNNGIPRGKNEIDLSLRDVHVDQKLKENIINDVLRDKLNTLHKHHETIGGGLIFETSGNLTDVSFSVHEGSIINPIEIEAIDNRLRSEVKPVFAGKAYLTHIAVSAQFGDFVF